MPARVARLAAPIERVPGANPASISAKVTSSQRQITVDGFASSVSGRGAAKSAHSPDWKRR